MLKNDLISKTPLGRIEGEYDDAAEAGYKGKFGAVLARAGVGKTALLVQLTFPALLNGKNILHVSLNDPIDKVRLTYKSTFQGIADKVENPDPNDTHKFWEKMQHQQFIINVKKEGFAASRIEDQLKGLKGQDVALPAMILIDGMDFEVPPRETLDELKKLAETYDLAVWFTVQTHRHEEPDERGLPVQLTGIDDLFHRAVWIRPDDTGIHVDTIIGDVKGEKSLLLDPETMVIK